MGGPGLEADYGEGVFLFGFSLLSESLAALGAGGTPSLYLSPGGLTGVGIWFYQVTEP